MPIGLEDRLVNNASGFSIAGAIDNDIRGIYWVANTGARDTLGDANSNNSDLRAQYVICVVGSTPYIYTNSSIADPDWTNTANWQEFALGDLSQVISDVSTNTAAIGTNSTDISTNSNDIAANTSAIGVNTADIAANTTDITTNSGDIATNASGIATNAAAISGNDTDIAANTSDIATNAGDISTLQTNTSGNLTDSVTVHSDVSNAGSGQIITGPERTLLNSAVQPLDNVSDLTNDASYITSAQAPVQDVNGQNGNVTLDADDIDDTTTAHKFTTAADITKLAGIETNATADQTAAEIKTAYESNADTNEFSDAEQTKLAGIDTNATANQTDAHLLDRANHTGTQDVSTITGLGTAATADSSDFIQNDSATAAQPIRQYYANTAAFPSATTWHGAIAHSHTDGAMYFAHGGSWVKLGNDSDIFDGDYNSLTNQPNIPVVGTDAQAHDANLTTFVNAFTLPVTDGSNGQVLTTNGSGTLSFASSGGSGSTTLLGLTDTPAAFGSTGQVLAVNSAGNAVEFVNQSGGSGAQRTLTIPSGNGYSGDVVTFGSAPSGGFTVGELYYFASTGAWEEAYGTSTSTSIGMLGVCVNATTPELLVRGIIRSSNYANQFSLARRLYVSTLQGGSGRFMDSVPGSPPSGAVIRAAGFVTDAVNGVIMFDPSQDYITVT